MTYEGIEISVERKAIRSLRLIIKPNGMVVCRVPMHASDDAIAHFVQEHGNWLITAYRKAQSLQTKRQAIRYEDGETHRLWGRPMTLRVEEERGRESVAFYPDEIVLYAHPDRTPEQRKVLLYKGYYQQFMPVFREAFERWSNRLGEHGLHVSIRLMKTEWGSCTKLKRRMTFNVDLVRFDPLCMEYVIVHEMSHLVHANHSQDFWNLCNSRLHAAGMQDSAYYKKQLTTI